MFDLNNPGRDYSGMEKKARYLAARQHAKLTQVQLAEKVPMSQQMVSKLEKGLTSESAFDVKIALACGVRAEWLDSEDGPMEAAEVLAPADVQQLTAALVALVDAFSARTQAEGKELAQRLRLAQEDLEKAGQPAALLENLQGVAQKAHSARARARRPRTKR